MGGHYADFFSCCTACSGCCVAFLFFVAVLSDRVVTLRPIFLDVARHVAGAVLRFSSF